MDLSTPKTVPWWTTPSVFSVFCASFLLEPLQIGIFAFHLISHIRQRAWQIWKISQRSQVCILWTQPEHVADLKKKSIMTVGGGYQGWLVEVMADDYIVIDHPWFLTVNELLLSVPNHYQYRPPKRWVSLPRIEAQTPNFGSLLTDFVGWLDYIN